MADSLTPEKRSWNMSRIRSKNTAPERRIRSLLHRAGFRFRLHARNLPGRPDIVLPRYHSVVQVHGCFWHRHSGCRNTTTPATRGDFWKSKFEGTVERDKRNAAALAAAGWRIITVWECEIEADAKSVVAKIVSSLRGMQ
ncbi:MAG TPA: very short patch repair endonuclease [Xanthobacteraceae bacterium]